MSVEYNLNIHEDKLQNTTSFPTLYERALQSQDH
jgi:hypothetical protein